MCDLRPSERPIRPESGAPDTASRSRLSGSQATATLTLLVVDNGELIVKSCGVYTVDLVQENGALRFGAMDLALDLGF